MRIHVPLLAAALVITGCPSDPEPEPPKLAEGIYGALGTVRPDVSEEDRATFERGRMVAERHLTPEDGLGPHFNTSFCGSCHNRPVTGGSAGRYRNFLLTRQELSDGSTVQTGVNGVHPFLQLEGGARRALGEGTNAMATRNPIPFFGVGLLAEIEAESILANEDVDDADGDGISGRANYDRGFVGRFGRKSQTVSIEGFIRGPLFNHLGLTSNPLSPARKDALPVPSGPSAVATRANGLSVQTRGAEQAAAPDEPNFDEDGVPDPELAEQDLFDLVAFSMLLAAPEAEPLTEQTERGKAHFGNVGCDGCHVPTLKSPRGLIPLYSDLLLHDMGEALDDGVRMGLSTGAEFRTQPLWGVVATGPWLHDGRADTLHEAIALHGGEGSGSRDRYLALSSVEQDELLAFLASLGGREVASEGLVAPNTPIPQPGELGAPARPLAGMDLERFRAGRDAFDRNSHISEGLGPRFNGDSCRACHSEPALGGAGPIGLNVVRQGIVQGDHVVDPEMGTMAHRLLSAVDGRAPADPDANFFEMRQAPALFGLGLLEQIPEETILAREDPEDTNGDGVRGIAQRLPDGRLGRFGWKADVPFVTEFVRDAMTNELGLTLPDQPGLTFGRGTDDDDVPDPEAPMSMLHDIGFWLTELDGPARRHEDMTLEAEGALLFSSVGCDGCHVPTYQLPNGRTISPFTDLLLHETKPEGALGFTVHEASPRAFRTPPLWGVSRTAPFMHDGSASTLEAAIAAHDGEAARSAQAAAELDSAERAALLAFLRSL